MKNGTLIRQVINKISEIDFNNTQDRPAFGSIYEQILKDLQSAGNAGEFYTPRAVTQFIVNRADPQLKETVLDPACGTGGFLACTIDHKKEHYVKSAKVEELMALCDQLKASLATAQATQLNLADSLGEQAIA